MVDNVHCGMEMGCEDFCGMECDREIREEFGGGRKKNNHVDGDGLFYCQSVVAGFVLVETCI